jgi:hypothetical protein
MGRERGKPWQAVELVDGVGVALAGQALKPGSPGGPKLPLPLRRLERELGLREGQEVGGESLIKFPILFD